MRTRSKDPLHCRRPKNTAEQLFYDKMVERGLKPVRRGWPDYVLYCEDKDAVAFVEVKPRACSYLKRQQNQMMKCLSKLGAKCYTWIPDVGFIEYGTGKITDHVSFD